MHLGRVILLHHDGIVGSSMLVALAVGLACHIPEHVREHRMIHLHTLKHASEAYHHLLHKSRCISIGHHARVGGTKAALGCLVLGKDLL